MSTTTVALEEPRVLLYGIDWATLEALLEVLGDRRGGRMSYDGGVLEIMSPSRLHERLKKLLARMVETLALDRDLPLESAGSTTLLREDLEKGAEPDECYYLANAGVVQSTGPIHIPESPPPDLVIESEVSRRVLDRLRIYAAMGVPELWRCSKAGSVSILRLTRGGRYAARKASLAFPGLAAADLSRFVRLLGKKNETAIVREFRDWARKRLKVR